MSIQQQVNALCAQERLFRLEPIISDQPHHRQIFVARDLYALLSPPWRTYADGVRWGIHRRQLDRFLMGVPVSVRKPGNNDADSFLAKLHKTDGIWEMRGVSPPPAIRILGYFAEKDVFIALVWRRRKDLKGWRSPEWRQATGETVAAWVGLFGAASPLRSNNPNDHLTRFRLI